MLKMQIFTSSTVHKQTQSPNSILAKSCEKPERLHNVRAQIEKKKFTRGNFFDKIFDFKKSFNGLLLAVQKALSLLYCTTT